jgi:DNA invertase Pin-like site-specific DNA recombinase
MPSAVIYCRISDKPDHALDANQSLEAQEIACRAYAKQHGIEVKAAYTDYRLSGSTLERPGLFRAIAALAKNDFLLVYRLDRIARDLAVSLFIERKIHDREARILSASGEGTSLVADDATSRLVRQILNCVSEFERAAISARTKHAMKTKMANGQKISSKPPYGWEQSTHSKKLTPHPKTAPILEVIFHMTVQQYPISDIVAEARHMEVAQRLPPTRREIIQKVVERIQAGEHPLPENLK